MSTNKHSTRKLKRMASRQLKRVWRKQGSAFMRDAYPAAWRSECREANDRLTAIRTELTRRGETV